MCPVNPGRTQLINCFKINEKIRFVDLPGYGFAKVPLAVKSILRSDDRELSLKPQRFEIGSHFGGHASFYSRDGYQMVNVY